MNRRQAQARRSRGALFLLVLAFLSVLAPILADTYLCPMAKAARTAQLAQAEAAQHETSCCTRTEMAPPAVPGTQQWQTTCDCPRLSWDALPAEFFREPLNSSHPVEATVSLPQPLLERAPVPQRITHIPTRIVAPSGPPLWVRHQAFLC